MAENGQSRSNGSASGSIEFVMADGSKLTCDDRIWHVTPEVGDNVAAQLWSLIFKTSKDSYAAGCKDSESLYGDVGC